MEVVDNIADFAKKNENDLRRFLSGGRSGKGIRDADLVNDIIQNFYVRLISSNALGKFDPSSVDEKENINSVFNSYILTILCRMLPHEKRRNPNSRYTHISAVSSSEGGSSRYEDEADIFDFVYGGSDHLEYGVKRRDLMPSCFHQDEEDECIRHFISFTEYLKENEPNKAKAERMVAFVEGKMQGVLATEIAVILGVSDNMVKIIKNNIYDKYKKWDNPREVCYA